MSELPVTKQHFKVDTSRPRSRSKMRSKVRHVMAVASGMFPLMAVFIVAMSWFRLPELREPYYRLAVIFVACGMVTLIFYAWARSEKQRRREVAEVNREKRNQARAMALQAEEARRQAEKAGTIAKES